MARRLLRGVLRLVGCVLGEAKGLAVHCVGFSLGFGAAMAAAQVVLCARTKDHYSVPQPKVGRVLHEANPHTLRRLQQRLPSWLKDPSLERATWLNLLIARLWPALSSSMGTLLKDSLWQGIEEACYLPPGTIHLQRCSLGTFPPTVEYIRHVPTPDESSVLEALVHFTSNCSLVADLHLTSQHGAGKLGSSLGSRRLHLSEVHFSAVVRVCLAPLLGEFPCFGGAQVTFMGNPVMDARLSVFGADLLAIPPLFSMARNQVLAGLQDTMVWPRCLSISLSEADPGAQGDHRASTLGWGWGHRGRAAGILQLTVVAAHQLQYIFVPSPFVKASIDPVHSLATRALPCNGAPCWEEELRVPVFDPGEDVVMLELRDSSAVLTDSLMGQCALPVRLVREMSYQRSLLLSLKTPHGKASGTLEVLPRYLPLYTESRRLSRRLTSNARTTSEGASPQSTEGTSEAASEAHQAWQPGMLPPSRPQVSSTTCGGVLEVHVTAAADLEVPHLAYPGTDFVLCKLNMAGEEHKTAMVPAHAHPRWDETLDVVCRQQDMQGTLEVQVWWAETSLITLISHRQRLLGTAQVDLRDVLRNRRIVDVFSLVGGHGYLRLELVWLSH